MLLWMQVSAVACNIYWGIHVLVVLWSLDLPSDQDQA